MQQQQDQQNHVIQLALQEYEQGMNNFAQKMPKIYNKFNAFTKECFSEGTISKKHKQLIALSISVYTQDEYSIIFHTKSCVDLGCSEEEILDAIGVTMAFGGGTTMSQAVTLVQEAYQQFNKNNNDNVQ